MSKWGKFFFWGTIIWQIPCIWWILYYEKPNTSLILGLPSAVFAFALLYLIYALLFGFYLAWKYIDDPTGKGIDIKSIKEGSECK